MSSHLHIICSADGELSLSEIMRDFKKHTAKQIIKVINEEPESIIEWLLTAFAKACAHLKRKQKYKKNEFKSQF